MIHFLALATVVLASLAVADDAKCPVVLEAELVQSSGPGGRFGPALHVRLIGAKEVAVATDGFRVKVERGDKQVTVKLVLAEGKDSKGRSVIPSADALGVVKIESGEVAVVRMPSFASSVRPASNEFQKAVTEAVAGQVTLVVELEVSDLFGKRYGVMSGKFSAVASVPK
jgi:hypothetical protein